MDRQPGKRGVLVAQKIEYSANFKRNYVAVFAFFLFFLMIVSELVLALSIPAFVRREDAFANEIRKRRMILRFDHARHICREIQENSEIIAMEKKLLSDNLNYLAIYLRKEASKLTVDEVNTLDPLITQMYKFAGRLKSGKSFSSENRLDSSKYLDKLVQKVSDAKPQMNDF